MKLTMHTSLIFAFAVTGSICMAQVSELENEKQVINRAERAVDLPGTLVIRVNEDAKTVEVAHVAEQLQTSEMSSDKIQGLKFTSIDTNKTYSAKVFSGTSELDRDNARESWYFNFGFFGWNWGSRGWRGFSPSYNYFGYNYGYVPYYLSYWGGYNYYWYRGW